MPVESLSSIVTSGGLFTQMRIFLRFIRSPDLDADLQTADA
jgi:hypothetical protein